MTDAELSEIEARANAAFPLPWEYQRPEYSKTPDYLLAGPDRKVVCGADDPYVGPSVSDPEFHPTAEFIRCARTDVPALIAEVRRLRANEEFVEHLKMAGQVRPGSGGICGCMDCMRLMQGRR